MSPERGFIYWQVSLRAGCSWLHFSGLQRWNIKRKIISILRIKLARRKRQKTRFRSYPLHNSAYQQVQFAACFSKTFSRTFRNIVWLLQYLAYEGWYTVVCYIKRSVKKEMKMTRMKVFNGYDQVAAPIFSFDEDREIRSERGRRRCFA